MVIKESFVLTATTADIFAGNTSGGSPSRLNSLPANGLLTVEISCPVANATNSYSVTMQTPAGDVPFEDLVVPAGSNTGGSEYMLDSRTQLTFSFPATQGGHFLFSCTETGATTLFVIATLEF